MQDFANLLRQRLGAIPEPQAHPDPDILSAYAEQVLTPAERQKIQEHLAACAPCREVVFLSLPQLQEEEVAWRPVRTRSWALGLRWAALAAMIVVIIGLAVQQPWKEKSGTSSFNTASDLPAKPANSGETADKAVASAPATQAQAAPAPAQPAMSTARARQDEPVAAAKKPVPPKIVVPPAFAASRVPQAPSAAGMARTTGPANLSDNRSLVVNNSNNSPLVSAPAPRTEAEVSAADIFNSSRTIPPISAKDLGSKAAGTDSGNTGIAAAAPSASSSPGKLQRAWTLVAKIPSRVASAADKQDTSNGSGATAFSSAHVRFDPHSALADRAGYKLDASQLHWSISSDGKLIKSENRAQWHEAYPQDQDLQFRKVWADPKDGHEVWAGGTHLTIVHSWNGGIDWQRMKVNEPTAAGDITDISIDEGNVLVKTSNGQTFVSHDAGATWVPLKQNQSSQPR